MIDSLVNTARSRLLFAQKMFRFVSSSLFRECFDLASEEEQKKMKKMMEAGDINGLRRSLDELRPLEQKAMADLRKKAREANIKDWKYLPKLSLLSELQRLNGDGERVPGGNENISSS